MVPSFLRILIWLSVVLALALFSAFIIWYSIFKLLYHVTFPLKWCQTNIHTSNAYKWLVKLLTLFRMHRYMPFLQYIWEFVVDFYTIIREPFVVYINLGRNFVESYDLDADINFHYFLKIRLGSTSSSTITIFNAMHGMYNFFII